MTWLCRKSHLGWFALARSGHLLSRVRLPIRRKQDLLAAIHAESPAPLIVADDPVLDAWADQVGEYLLGFRQTFDISVADLDASSFTRRVRKACASIPYGETRSYGWLARAAGSPHAARAAGQVMARNPLPLVIPCHRIVRADGDLGGFGGGLDLKRRLLELESRGLRANAP